MSNEELPQAVARRHTTAAGAQSGGETSSGSQDLDLQAETGASTEIDGSNIPSTRTGGLVDPGAAEGQ